MTRLELAGIRVCKRCGRGRAELRGGDGVSLVIGLDPVRAQELAHPGEAGEMRSFTELVLERFADGGVVPSEVVLDVAEGRLRALVSVVRGDEPDVVTCPAEEGLGLAVRGGLKLYATEEALAHGAKGARKQNERGGTGGSDTIH